MTTRQHQSATDVSSAGPPTAVPSGDAAGGAMTLGGSITVAGAIVIFVAISIGLLSLQYCFDAWDRESHGTATWSRRRRRRRSRGDDGTAGSNSGSRGVDPELLRSLPVTVYRAAAPGSKGDTVAVECSVCLAELADGDEARFLPRCGHGFHAECFNMWLASHTTCPLCRLTVSKPDDPVASQTPAPAFALRPLPPEPANLCGNMLLGVADPGAVTAANMAAADGDDTAASTGAVVIEIPELAPVPTPTPCVTARCGGGTAAGGGDPEPELLLRSLPAATVRRAAPHSNKEDAAECVVCLAELEDGEVARFLPCCNRGFHAQCVDTWLASQSTCPLCRINVVAMSGMALESGGRLSQQASSTADPGWRDIFGI